MKYTVTITETLVRKVLVEAESEDEAVMSVKDGWLNGEYELDANNFVDADFTVDQDDMDKKMRYSEMEALFYKANDKGYVTEGYIVFTSDSFDTDYDELSRTYVVSSNNKAFQVGAGGYSIFASCLDGTDSGIRLDFYMSGDGEWKIEKCYMSLEEYNRIAALLNEA